MIMDKFLNLLLAVLCWTLMATNAARFVMEVAEHRDITWGAYGYAALAGLMLATAINATRKTA